MARTVAAKLPALAIAADNNPSVAALNVILGCVGVRGGIIENSGRTKAHSYASPVIQNARAVLIDSSVPWNFVPQTDAEVFRFTAWDGGATKADWLLPAPGFLEELTDVPTAPASSVETYAVAPSLAKAPPEARSAAQFLTGFDPTLTPAEKIIHSRCEELFRRRTGIVYGQETTPMAKFASVQKLEEQLSKGAVWAGEPPPSGNLRFELKEWPGNRDSASPEDWATQWSVPVQPPLASKLYVESNLREPLEGRNA